MFSQKQIIVSTPIKSSSIVTVCLVQISITLWFSVFGEVTLDSLQKRVSFDVCVVCAVNRAMVYNIRIVNVINQFYGLNAFNHYIYYIISENIMDSSPHKYIK